LIYLTKDDIKKAIIKTTHNTDGAVVNHAKTTKTGILQKTDENKSENRTTAQNQGQD